jgi:AcrR family transcriptional regulator
LSFDVYDIRTGGLSKQCLNYAGVGKVDHSGPQERPYHHGDLHRTILDAAYRRLETSGLEAVTIRACARDAGVSPGAPIHHFGSLKGLLSELAARGFGMLVARLDADRKEKADRSGGALLVGAYVAFAVSNPKVFDLMWRDDVLDPGHAGLQAARQKSLERLKGLSDSHENEQTARLAAVRNWSLAHGLALLLINERMVAALGSTNDGLTTTEDFVALAYSDDFVAEG